MTFALCTLEMWGWSDFILWDQLKHKNFVRNGKIPSRKQPLIITGEWPIVHKMDSPEKKLEKAEISWLGKLG